MDRVPPRQKCGPLAPAREAGSDRRELLREIREFVLEHRDVTARLGRYSPGDLERLAEECCRLRGDADREGACGAAGSLAELQYLIDRAGEMRGSDPARCGMSLYPETRVPEGSHLRRAAPHPGRGTQRN